MPPSGTKSTAWSALGRVHTHGCHQSSGRLFRHGSRKKFTVAVENDDRAPTNMPPSRGPESTAFSAPSVLVGARAVWSSVAHVNWREARAGDARRGHAPSARRNVQAKSGKKEKKKKRKKCEGKKKRRVDLQGRLPARKPGASLHAPKPFLCGLLHFYNF